MSSWWERKLGGVQQPQQAQPVYPQTQQPVQPQVQQPMQALPQGYAPGHVQPEDVPAESVSEALRQHVTVAPQKARAFREETNTCPECGSGNVFTGVAHETGRKKPHCFNCGWPNLQSGSGMATLGGAQVPHMGPSKQTYTPPPPPEPGYPAPKGFTPF